MLCTKSDQNFHMNYEHSLGQLQIMLDQQKSNKINPEHRGQNARTFIQDSNWC